MQGLTGETALVVATLRHLKSLPQARARGGNFSQRYLTTAKLEQYSTGLIKDRGPDLLRPLSKLEASSRGVSPERVRQRSGLNLLAEF